MENKKYVDQLKIMFMMRFASITKYVGFVANTDEIEVHGICSLTRIPVARRQNKTTGFITEYDTLLKTWVPIERGLTASFQYVNGLQNIFIEPINPPQNVVDFNKNSTDKTIA